MYKPALRNRHGKAVYRLCPALIPVWPMMQFKNLLPVEESTEKESQ